MCVGEGESVCAHIYVYIYIYIYIHKKKRVRVCERKKIRERVLCMTVSTENATPPKSIESRNSDFSISRVTRSNRDFGSISMYT